MTEQSSADLRPEHIQIQIDRVHYEVDVTQMTGEQLRQLPKPPIGPDRDLFEVVPGHSDRKIENSEEVELRNGTRFFTAPAHINPGQTA
jgi:Multiubiquitin